MLAYICWPISANKQTNTIGGIYSDADVVIGVVMMMLRRLIVSVNVSPRLFSIKT